MRREEARVEAVVAAGGLRRPPTKSPDRIPFGFRPPLRRVNNVFTRRFASFAVRPPRSVPWLPLFVILSACRTPLFFLLLPLPNSFFSSSFSLLSLFGSLSSLFLSPFLVYLFAKG